MNRPLLCYSRLECRVNLWGTFPTFEAAMKKIVFLFALYILVKPAVPVIDFVVNYGYIVAELCINRDRPELECNGTCYLQNELAEASQWDIPISQERKIPLPANELFFERPSVSTPTGNITRSSSITKFWTSPFHLELWARDLLRPPIFMS